MSSFLQSWFAKCNRGLIELGWYDPEAGALNKFRRFGLDEISEAVLFACAQNAIPGTSFYFRPATVQGSPKWTTDADVAQFPGCWCDCDTRESVQRMLTCPVIPSVEVITGRTPTLRAQFFIKFSSDPLVVGDWVRGINRQLRAVSGSDPAVTNPSSFMRLPGSIAWPTKPGRTDPELTEVVIPQGGGGTFSLDFLRSVLPKVEQTTRPQMNGADTGADTILNPIGALIHQIRTAKGGWHNLMVALTAKLVSRGVPRDAILATAAELTWPGYAVEQTKAEISKMLDGAYRKGFGPEADEVEDIVEDVMNVPPKGSTTFPLLTISDLLALPEPVWLIKDRIVADSLCVLYGPLGSYKSFAALHVALCLATGLPFFGQAVVRCDVLYIAGEGAGGIRRRVEAWLKHHKIDDPPGFRIVPEAVNLLDRSEAARLIKTVLEAQKADGFAPRWVIVDTLHRAMPGGDENAAKEMGVVIANGAFIQRTLGCGLMPVHHSGKDLERGMRGSTGLPGAADTVLQMIRDTGSSNVRVRIEKQKDGEDGHVLHLRAELIDLPPVPGSVVPRNSLVLVPGEAGEAPAAGETERPKGHADLALRVLRDAIITQGVPLPPTSGFPTVGMRGVPELTWRREFNRRLADSTSSARRQAFGRAVDALQAARLVGLLDTWVWLTEPDRSGRP